jgi:DNA-binding MarR family transcriptional regulator
MNRHVDAKRQHPGVLENSIYHQLKRVEQLAADIFALRAGRSGLTQRQYALLSSLSENEGASQAELVRRTGIDRSTLADLAARLEARGLLRRRRCQHDRRANELFLTPQGRQALEALAPLMRELDEILLSALPEELTVPFVQALRLLALPETSRRLCHHAAGDGAGYHKPARPAERKKTRLPAPRRDLERGLPQLAGASR